MEPPQVFACYDHLYMMIKALYKFFLNLVTLEQFRATMFGETNSD